MRSVLSTARWIFFILVMCVGAVGAWFFFTRPHATPMLQSGACTEEAKICPDGRAVGRSGPQCEFAICPTPVYNWIVTDTGLKSKSGAPLINVSLSLNGKEYRVGTYEGACGEIGDANWPLFEGEQAGAACWFARDGIELGIFEQEGRLVLKKSPLTEGATDSEIIRGTFETILELTPLP